MHGSPPAFYGCIGAPQHSRSLPCGLARTCSFSPRAPKQPLPENKDTLVIINPQNKHLLRGVPTGEAPEKVKRRPFITPSRAGCRPSAICCLLPQAKKLKQKREEAAHMHVRPHIFIISRNVNHTHTSCVSSVIYHSRNPTSPHHHPVGGDRPCKGPGSKQTQKT